jgi:acyl-CoA dehydrogenase
MTEGSRSVHPAPLAPDTGPVRAFLEERHLELAERAGTFCGRDVAPRPEPADDLAARREARELLRLLGEGGWLGPIAAQDFRACCLVREALGASSPLADAVFALQALGSTPLLLAGDDAARTRWLGPAVRGEAMAAFAMTEPGAGSDVASMRTRATPVGDGYVLEGRKAFISNAGIADFYVVFAVTDPDAGRRGLSAFAVPADAPGLDFVAPQLLSSPHPLGEIEFHDCRIPASARLGEEGRGLSLGMATLDRLRPTVAAAACGMAGRALGEAVTHAISRRQFGKPLADFQLIQEKLARMATELTAARLLTYRAAWERDTGAERTTMESAMAKAHATEAAQRIVDEAVQVLGGRGVLADHPVERLYRSVRALRIYEGTTEIQRLIIAAHLVEEARRSGAEGDESAKAGASPTAAPDGPDEGGAA